MSCHVLSLEYLQNLTLWKSGVISLCNFNWKSGTCQQRRYFLQRFPCGRSVSFKQCDNRPVPAPASSIRVPWRIAERQFFSTTPRP
jgi:hypothetical protein